MAFGKTATFAARVGLEPRINGIAIVGETVSIYTPFEGLPHFMEAQIAGRSDWIALTPASPMGGFEIPPQAAGCRLRVCYVRLDESDRSEGVVYSQPFGPVGLTLASPDITVSSVTDLNAAIQNDAYSVVQVAGGTYDGSAVVFTDRSSVPLTIQSDPLSPAVFSGEMDFSGMRSVTWKGHEHSGSATEGSESALADTGSVLESLRITGRDISAADAKTGDMASVNDGPWWSLDRLGNITYRGLMIYNMRGFQVNQWTTITDVSWKYCYFDGFRAVSMAGNTVDHDFIEERVTLVGVTGVYEEESASAPHVDATQCFNTGGGLAPTIQAKGPVLRNVVEIIGNTRAYSDVGDAPILQVSAGRTDDTILDGCFWSGLQSGINSAYSSEGMVVRRSTFKRPEYGGGAVRFGSSSYKYTVGFLADRSSYSAHGLYPDSTAYAETRDNDKTINTTFDANYRGPDTLWDVGDWMLFFVANAPKTGTDSERRGALDANGNMIMLEERLNAPGYSTSQTASSITVDATAVAGAEYYLLRYREGSGGAWSLKEFSSESMTISGLSNGTEYQMQIAVSTEAAGFGRWSPVFSVTTS
ncbi:fibronectin type III domain-containing protein [Tropicimonas sp. TH_r6]|uniref:fibronectin type III domain-containing protein n=1 Tax=Tropicimonas sp. TH_r6 TaxID=3082085 RepID=UPI002955194D|nr:fibronectin type III domain-containing protein [Tropicimonas sp. TH_r6]MDV7144461.1 fibronectin type III domain-containing protein [Tropicimonas sp. TH_r6]